MTHTSPYIQQLQKYTDSVKRIQHLQNYDNNNDKNITEHISLFLRNADWFDIVEKYKHFMLQKEQNKNNITTSEKELKLLGALREFIVDLLFNEYDQNRKNYYFAFGSNNILSDYDITIVGLNACEIAENIYTHYFTELKKPMATSFDTNIYCAGFYLYDIDSINPNIKDNIVIFKDTTKNIELFNFQPTTLIQIKMSILYAFIKLTELTFNTNLYRTIQYHSNQLKKELGFNLSLEDSYENMFQSANNLYSQIYNSTFTDINTIYENVCKTQYYSIESYYTPCTVNVVVLEMQAGKQLDLNESNHIISILENLGDLLQHWKKEHDFIKVSKYIYRIYYSFQKLGIIDNKSTLDEVKNSVSNRGNSNQFQYKPFFEYINYERHNNKDLFIETIKDISLEKLEKSIQEIFGTTTMF